MHFRVIRQSRWGTEYADTELFSGGMKFSDGGRVVEDKMLKAVLEQKGFLAAFTGKISLDERKRVEIVRFSIRTA